MRCPDEKLRSQLAGVSDLERQEQASYGVEAMAEELWQLKDITSR